NVACGPCARPSAADIQGDRILTFTSMYTSPRGTRRSDYQGSPVSPVLYLFYNADLLEACKTSGH
ncbi:hypothetical protein GE09DRAFT_1151486, partial [Coniochaeta sp. 2T2.1]